MVSDLPQPAGGEAHDDASVFELLDFLCGVKLEGTRIWSSRWCEMQHDVLRLFLERAERSRGEGVEIELFGTQRTAR